MLQKTAGGTVETSEVFTQDELLKALHDAQSEPIDDAGIMTGPELAEALGISTRTTQKRVKLLIKGGVIESAPKRIVNILGFHTIAYGYRLVEK